MKEILRTFRGKWKWIAGITALFAVVFSGVLLYQHKMKSSAADTFIFVDYEGTQITSGGMFTMRRAEAQYSLIPPDGVTNIKGYKWISMNEDILKIISESANYITLQVQNIGSCVIQCEVTYDDDTHATLMMTVDVVFSINDYLSGLQHVKMDRIFPGDQRKAIIMDVGAELQIGTSASVSQNLNLIYGNAQSATWSSSNTDVFSASSTAVMAKGVGVATLSVSYQDPKDQTMTYSDSIQVYVRPEISDPQNLDEDDEPTVIAGGMTPTSETAVVNNGDKLRVSVVSGKSSDHPEIPISDKMVWVISKEVGENTELVRDSLGNTGPDAADAKLTYFTADKEYRVDAKAGRYIVQFYVKGTYTSWDGAKSSTCNPVNVNLSVNCDFENKNETINLGGFYSLSEAFNIPLNVLKENFTVISDAGNQAYIDINTDEWRAYANKGQLGTATFEVQFNASSSAVNIPGLNPDNMGTVTVTLVVADTFTMNMTNLTMAVGSTQVLSGVIGSGAYSEASQFKWSVSDEKYVTLSNTDSQLTTVTAKQTTPTNNPVIVNLEWQDSHGVTHVASCSIIVTTSATNFSIMPGTLRLEAGSSEYLNTTLTGTQNITWLSSDADLVKVEAQAGNVAAKVTATTRVGSAVITAYNKDNDSYATCVVTVVASVASLRIDKGESFSASLASGFVFMKAVYQPTNATETEMEWSSSDTKVATVDSLGTVTLHKKGQTTITVKPAYNPNGLFAQCVLSVTETPIRTITTNVDNLNMIKGNSQQVLVNYQPTNATETSMTWTSLDRSVATVSADGLITAVGVGTTNIMVSANVAYDTDSNPNRFAQAVITVNVRNRLESIAYESNTLYVAKNRTQQVNIVFSPADNVNKNLTFKSSNEDVFKVSPTGVLTGVSVGQAMLSCIAEDLGESGIITCMVYVLQEPVYATDFMIVPETHTMEAGTEYQMLTQFVPENTTERDLTWSSSDTAIAEVDSNGLVTAKTVGSTILTAVYNDAQDGVPIVHTCTLTVDPPAIHATEFDVTPATQNLVVGEQFSIVPVFTPADTTNKNVEYQSTDTEVITVDANGLVTAVGPGEAVIGCQSEDTGTVATCYVHVDNAIKFSLSPSKREIALGKSFTLKKVTEPANATKTAEWKSSNTKIATVNSDGKVTGKKLGSCTITCTLTKYHQSATCRVTVANLKTKIKLDKTSIRMGLGQTYRLKKTITTNNSKEPGVKWKSSNKRIVTVNNSGKLTAKKVGMAKVTVTTKDAIHAKATCKVRVIRRASSISVSPSYMVCYIGRTRKIKTTVKPSSATIKKVKYTSGNKDIATVTGTGKVLGIAEGDTYITVQATDGSNKRAKVFVKVLEAVPATSVVVAQPDMTLKKGDTAKISYTVLPNDTSDSLKFASDNKRVAKVNKKGKITAVGTGNATITILTTSGVTSDVNVNVVALNKSKIRMRQYDTETLVVHGTSEKITWYSSNPRVATVSGGKVVGKGKGTTKIYAYVDGCRLGCKVTITSVNSKRQ